MRNIFIIGAGRSSPSLIKYLLDHSSAGNWRLTVGDISEETARQKTGSHPKARAIGFDILNRLQREKEIGESDLVISMLPAHLHTEVAIDCVRMKKHLVTASYVSPAIRELDREAARSGVLLMNEAGLDPGIDHASAMKIIDRIKSSGATITAFRSYCGGLIAPESNDNPWGYKFTWNPRNVVLAGQGTAQFIQDGQYKYIPYNRLFLQTEIIDVEGHGKFEAYANRDSLSYRKPYGLDNIPTMIRGTLRMPGFCHAWHAFVALGLTDDTYPVTDCHLLSCRQLLEAYLPSFPGLNSTEEKLAAFLGENKTSDTMQKLAWLGLFSDKKIPLENASPARILQHLLEEKWKLGSNDKDMIVMQHQFEYEKGREKGKIYSSLAVKGDDPVHTAMAKTVGLPVAIISELILNEKIKARGVHIPVLKEVYEPLLKELENFNIHFIEKTVEV